MTHQCNLPTPSQFNGSFTTVSATELGATAIKSALEKSKVPVSSIDAVYMGNVLGAGVGQAPARQAAIFAGLPTNVEATTINKVCASGLKAVNLAAASIELGQAEAQIAGGMENMTRVPYYLNRASQQPAFGHQKLQDGLIADGLWDVYNQIHMGNCAENTAKKHNVTREEQDEYAILSYKRAQQAYKDGLFKEEIVPVTVKSRKGETVITEDEQYNKLKLDKVSTLKPAFEKGPNGTVTAANSSPLSDGASALVLGSKEIAQKYGKDSRVLAKIITYADASVGKSLLLPPRKKRAPPPNPPPRPNRLPHRPGLGRVQAPLAIRPLEVRYRRLGIQRGLRRRRQSKRQADRPERRQGEPARRRHCAGPRARQLGEPHPRHAAAPAAGRRVRCCGDL
jgi:acetyl-CoA acetyltransferase family protein